MERTTNLVRENSIMNKARQNFGEISLKSFGKINLAIDVDGYVDEIYHQVDMIMALVDLADAIVIRCTDVPDKLHVLLTTNKTELPVDGSNLAIKAVNLLESKGLAPSKGLVEIHIEKNIPLAAGLAGGSGNAAAVLHGLNLLWNLNLSLEELMKLGSELGSDVPFCIGGQARACKELRETFQDSPLATTFARARGRGTDLTPIKAHELNVVIGKPHIGVSTKEVYQNIDKYQGSWHPSIDKLEEVLNGRWENDDNIHPCEEISQRLVKLMGNVLEDYTLKAYGEVQKLIKHMEEILSSEVRDVAEDLTRISKPYKVMMCGSGPTVIGLCADADEGKRCASILKDEGYFACSTYTLQ